MKSFISEVLGKLRTPDQNISELVIILPSKRAGAYLLKELAAIIDETIFAPTIYSIEEFTEVISNLQGIDNTVTLFEFYNVYKELTPVEEQETFETFVTWAQSLIHDFNEIDRYLINHKPFFDYLSGIQDIKHWYLQQEKTELIEKYLAFWKRLPEYYESLSGSLLEKQQGYQGLIYRKASENIEEYSANITSKHVFIGFNALNASEQHIIQFMLEKGHAEVFWDLDGYFYHDPAHGASLFLRQYLENWKFYQENSRPEFSNKYSEEKEIKLIGVPKNIGQAKYLGEIITELTSEELENTAIVLGEEDLLLPVLNSLPAHINDLNVTMGFPVDNAPVSSLFENIFQIHISGGKDYYYKDILGIINHPALFEIISNDADRLIRKINKDNLVYLRPEEILAAFTDENRRIADLCFKPKNDSVTRFSEDVQELIQILKTQLEAKDDTLSLEFLYHFYLLFNKLETLNEKFRHIKTIKSLYDFYKEMVSTETLDFQGRPFKGLQLMGMLESRALDFETVIITSLNEGTLPAGKSDNSFIPYDLKQEYKLPTYREKDAVYTYHFYRLLQRAKKVFLLYNTEADGLNSGEKSRFITQLEIESFPSHHISQHLVSPMVPVSEKKLREVEKTPQMMERIRNLAGSGFSPSALTTYMRNPLDFYHQYVLGVRDQEEVEETVAFNTLGTVVHNALENLYKPLESELLSLELILKFKKQANDQIAREFAANYSKAPLDKGRNLLIFEVAKRYMRNFLNFEIKRLESGTDIQILQIEKDLKVLLPMDELSFPVYLRGKVDRVEKANGVTRIVDYKTGKVESKDLIVKDWNEITKDYDKFAKSFQVLTYATLISLEKDLKFPAEAGIISFKNLRSGFLKFQLKTDKKPDSLIKEETLENFQKELKKLIMEICNPEIPFIEKEIKSHYGSF
ncbi:PD-(D/E)XK nuclease family protein [Christiangramia portivictoriae]|uniref:PD-(D/E)XK nuclease family protein n=1 Tax=Christiangramia portivictoriae TaxID=326069 RepID=UPI0004169F04|nr:PD-(D/E)XK nuclease family protein [Christiangramia portivictoriae]